MSEPTPERQRCPHSGATMALRGMNIIFQQAVCPGCGKKLAISPKSDRTAVLPRHYRPAPGDDARGR